MKKKILSILTLCFVLFTALFGLTACDNNGDNEVRLLTEKEYITFSSYSNVIDEESISIVASRENGLAYKGITYTSAPFMIYAP